MPDPAQAPVAAYSFPLPKAAASAQGLTATASSAVPDAGSDGSSLAQLQEQLAKEKIRAEIDTLRRRRLADSAGVPTVNVDDPDENLYNGKSSYPDQALALARKLPGSDVRDIASIMTGDFKAHRLVYLRKRPHDPFDSKTSITTDSEGRLTSSGPKVASSKQFDNDVFLWAECLLNYIFIYTELFGQQHLDVVAGLNRFLAFVLKQGRTYQASACIQYALASMNNNLANRHNAELWAHQDKDWVDE